MRETLPGLKPRRYDTDETRPGRGDRRAHARLKPRATGITLRATGGTPRATGITSRATGITPHAAEIARCATAIVVVSSIVVGVAWLAGRPVLAQGADAARPTRIVSIVPAATEILFAIGAGSRVVAVGSFDTFPPAVERLPRVGALLDPDVERILSLTPDLAVVYGSQLDLVKQLERSGVRLFRYTHGGLADVAATVRALGAATGDTAAAEDVARRLERGVDLVGRRVAGRPRPRVLLVFGREPGGLRNIHASGGVGFLHDMLDAAGGENVLADVERESAQVTTEQVLARRPDVILEVRAVGPTDEASLARERNAWRRLSSVPAVRTGRVVFLSGAEFVVPGPRVVTAIERMAEAIQGGGF